MKISPASILGVALGAALLFGGYLLFTGGERKAETPAPRARAEAAAAQVLTGVRLEGTGKDGARWVLTAERAESDAAGEIGELTGIRLDFTGRSGEVMGRAARAERRRGEEVYRFGGGVEIRRGEWTAFAQSVTYDPVRGMVNGEEGVRLDSGAVSLTGKFFETDLNETWARTHGGSSATIKGAVK